MPSIARATSFLQTLVSAPGNQTAPSLRSGAVAYLDDLGVVGGLDAVRFTPLSGGAPRPVTDNSAPHAWPRLGDGVVAYRSPDHVELVSLQDVYAALPPALPVPDRIFAKGMGRIALGQGFVAWEQESNDPLNSTDVAWQPIGGAKWTGSPTVLAAKGRQGGVAAVGVWLAWIDFEAGSVVHVRDTTGQSPERVLDLKALGTVTEIALDASSVSGLPRLVVASLSGADTRIDVVEGTLPPVATLQYPGAKVNPHLYGGWVGFEDLSTSVSQVVLWDWLGSAGGPPKRYLPWMSGTEQRLHDLVVSAGVDVVWSQMTATLGFDIYRYYSDLPMEAVLKAGPPTATCADPDPAAELTVTRGTGKPTPDGRSFPLNGATTLLVCMEASDATAAWVAAGEKVVAAPGDFGRGWVSREVRVAATAGRDYDTVGAVVAGKPGSTLHVKVFLESGGNGNGSSGSTCGATGSCPPAPAGLARGGSFGCSSAGAPASLVLLLLPAALLLAPRRRPRR